ncbi:hypothetical protein HYV50_04670 [Candidatus Pacearchaeota archaeon]|nr:hypothetical protein [Candidatus Pacearchaeota archaeon]
METLTQENLVETIDEDDWESDEALISKGFQEIAKNVFFHFKTKKLFGRCSGCNFMKPLKISTIKSDKVVWICSPCNSTESTNGQMLFPEMRSKKWK